MVQVKRYLILILSSGVLGCSKATPTFDLLDESAIPQPKFSGSTVKNLTTANTGSTFNISGECDPKIKSIVALPITAPTVSGFSSVGDFAASPPVVSCSTAGTFSFVLKSLSDLGFTGFSEGKIFEIQLKGLTSAGFSRPSFIRVTYSTGNGNRNIWLAAGGVHGGGDNAFRASDGTFKADISVTFQAGPTASEHTDGTVKARIGAAAR